MTDDKPPTQAGSSTNSIQNPYSGHVDPQRTMFFPTYSTGSNVLPYGNYSSWSNLWSSNYSGYAAMAVNPALHARVPPYGTGYVPQKLPNAISKTTPTSSAPARVNTPPLADPDTYRHWDDVLQKFLEKTKLTQCRRGFELDLLVLNAEWEQRVLPEALKDLVHGMQVILDRISGKTNSDTKFEAIDTNNTASPFEPPPLDERKLDYIKVRDGKKPESQSSVTKSISQFIARSRARNDLSNRAEFLQTLVSEKRQASTPEVDSTSSTTEVQEIFSCARVDAKTIDRANQIKYDIMKNEGGPLTRTTSIKPPPPSDSALTTQNLYEPPRKRRRLADVEDSAKKSSKIKSKATEGQPPVLISRNVQDETDFISPPLIPAIDQRMRNVEEHLSVRYVPSRPQTLLARLKFLEDHLIRLEKEYPPWAALHFNQPNRGWPPPPRSTPVIVPPHLRSTTGKQSSNSSADAVHPPASTAEVIGQPSVKPKTRHKTSTLHKAVMDRLEIQQAMNEMGIQ